MRAHVIWIASKHRSLTLPSGQFRIRPTDATHAGYATMPQAIRLSCDLEYHMARRLKDIKEIKIERPQRAKLSAKEVIKRMEEFPKRKEKFIATVRKDKN
jgi:hypothetical protein